MAWNESFSADGGWGTNETSFATSGPQKDSTASRIAEKLNIPVTISDLCESPSPDEKYVLGEYAFGKILTMGIVRSYEQADQTQTSYILSDPSDPSKEYSIVQYHGVDENRAQQPIPFVEGTYIVVSGKLRHLNGNFGIMVFDLREVPDPKEYEAFILEVKISKDYFTKNVGHLLQAGKADALKETCVGAPPPRADNMGGQSIDNASSFGSQQSRIYNAPASHGAPATSGGNAAQNRGVVGQRGKILEVLEGNKDYYGESGMSIDEIKVKIGAMNIGQLRTDLDFLVSEGHIFATINEDTFAIIG